MRKRPALGVGAPRHRQQLLHVRILGRVGQAAQLAHLGEYRDAVHDRVQRDRAELHLDAALDKRSVDAYRQFVHQAVGGGPLGVVDDELQDGGSGHWQLQWNAVAEGEPRGPVAKRRAVAREVFFDSPSSSSSRMARRVASDAASGVRAGQECRAGKCMRRW